MSNPEFSQAELNQWSDDVSDQLNALTVQQAQTSHKNLPNGQAFERWIPEKQRSIIESQTGMDAETFWERYKEQARLDLCQSEGKLHKLWHQWKDLPTKDVVKMSGSALTGMGLSHDLMATVGVAASVVLLYVLLNIGINTICEGKESDEKKLDSTTD